MATMTKALNHQRQIIFFLTLLLFFPACGNGLNENSNHDAQVNIDIAISNVTASDQSIDKTCLPLTCTTDGKKWCGTFGDGCNNQLVCGECTKPNTCGGGGIPHQCGLSLCNNEKKDADETDVDCGGPCTPCALDKACKTNTDCSSGSCIESICRTNKWQTLADMPTPRGYLAAVAGPNGKIYAIGGISPEAGQLSKVEVYDPKMNSWSTRAPLPKPRYGLSAVLGKDGLIYAIGGSYDSDSSPYSEGDSVKVDAYDPDTNTWKKMPNLNIGRYMGAAVSAQDGKIYAIGGFSITHVDHLDIVEAYLPGTNSWVGVQGPMTYGRSCHGAALGKDGRIYAIGGKGPNDSILAAFEYFIPGSGSWNTLPPMPTPRQYLAAATDHKGNIYAIGGLSASKKDLATVEMYSPTSGKWFTVASMPTGRDFHTATTGADGRIYVLGGIGGEFMAEGLATVEVYTP